MSEFVRDRYELYKAVQEAGIPVAHPETPLLSSIEELEEVDFALDRNGFLKFITPNIEQILEYRPSELTGRHFVELVPPHFQDQARTVFKEVSSGKSLRFEIGTTSANGSKHWIGGCIRPLYRRSRIQGGQGSFADITARKQEEQTLRESAQRHSSMIEQSRDGFVVVCGASCVYINKAVTDMTGYTLGDLAGLDVFDLLALDTQKQVLNRYNQYLARQHVDRPFEAKIFCKDGSVKVLEAALAPSFFAGHAATVVTVRDITERRKQEEAQQESDALLRLLLKNVEDAVWTTDLDLNLTYYGPPGAHLVRYTTEEELSRKLADRLSPETLEQARDLVSAQLAMDGQPGIDPQRSWTMELEAYSSTGKMIWADAKTTFIRDTDGKPIGLLGVSRDITARKQIEIRLQESELLYSTLIEKASDGIAIVQDGLYVFVNPAMETITGYSPSELIGKSFLDLVIPERRDYLEDRFRLWQMGDHTSRMNDMKMVRKDGRVRNVEIFAKEIPYRDRPAIMGVMRDVTSRRRVEAALWRSQERLRLIFESVGEGITVTDLECQILDVNRKAIEIYGIANKDEVYGKPAFDYIASDEIPLALERLPETVAEGSAYYSEFTLRKQDGTEFPAELTVSVLKDLSSTPTGFVVVTRDISERKRAEQALQEAYTKETRLRQELEDEITKRTEFLRGLVHELKTPLTSMMVSSELLSDNLEMPALAMARNLRRGTHSLNRRIDELMDLARGEMGILKLDLKAIYPSLLLKTVYDDFAALAAEKNVVLKCDLPASLSAIWADADRLRQVLQNLVENAIKFISDQGHVTLRARQGSEMLFVEVEDTGPGIPAQQQARLFDPYYRPQGVRGRKSGLGLGLALSKTLVELHGGSIWVTSSEGEGTVFGLSIPRKLPREKKEARDQNPDLATPS